MTNTYSETILLELPLPQFLIDFKDTCVGSIVPGLTSIINDLENPDANHSTLSVLSAIFLFLIIKALVSGLFTFKAPRVHRVTQPEVDNEIRLLTNEIRKMKDSLRKIIEENSQAGSAAKGPAAPSNYDSNDIKKLIEYYQKSAEDFNSLAEFVLSSQESILKKMKVIKKNKIFGDRTPSQGSRGSVDSELNEGNREPEVKKQEIQPETKQTELMTQSEKKPAPKPFKPPAVVGRKRGVPPPPVPR